MLTQINMICYAIAGNKTCRSLSLLDLHAEATEGKSGTYEWAPKGLKPFDLPAPTAGGDVAAVKAGHVSISPLRTGFIQTGSQT